MNMKTLPKLPPGELPEGVTPCTACGALGRSYQKRRAEHPRLRFQISGCRDCGHIMRLLPNLTCRDLTRAEAAELAESPDFRRMRQYVDAHLMSRNLWG